MEILIELRYWMVLFLLFSALSMVYAGLVLCCHLVYCVRQRKGSGNGQHRQRYIQFKGSPV